MVFWRLNENHTPARSNSHPSPPTPRPVDRRSQNDHANAAPQPLTHLATNLTSYLDFQDIISGILDATLAVMTRRITARCALKRHPLNTCRDGYISDASGVDFKVRPESFSLFYLTEIRKIQ